MTQVQPASTGFRQRRIEDTTRGRIRSYLRSKDDWNPARGLKNLTEQAVRDYEHRAVVELVQNAHDAQDGGEQTGRILVRLDPDEGEHGVLYVANTGNGFGDSNFDAISDVARSDKRPDEGIGNKGIGFKSVLQLSRSPEVYSTATHLGDAYSFRFATGPELREQLISIVGPDIASDVADIERDVFHLCLPLPQPHRPAAVIKLLAEGYATVVRLPLKSDDARADAMAQMRLLGGTPPTLLFLRRIAELTVEIGGLQPARETLRRRETPLAGFDGGVSASIVDLGPAGRYFVADKLVPEATLAEAIRRSIEGDHISEGWRDWRGDAHVSIAATLGDEPGDHRLYTHLPMGRDARAPLAAHVNAPFFAKLARVGLEQSVPLNDTLLDEVAMLCARLLLAARSGDVPIDVDTLADLLSWTTEDAGRLRNAFGALGHDAATVPVVPIEGDSGARSSLSQVFAWDGGGRKVLTTEGLARRAHVPLLPAALSKRRRASIGATARTLAGRPLTAPDEEIAGWAERIAQGLTSAPFDPDVWMAYYDDLAGAVRQRTVLRGRTILIDDDGRLRACNSDRGGPTAFFSPRSDADAPDAAGDTLKPPESLRHRLFYVSSALPWNTRTGSVITKRPGRTLLEAGLVREYRAATLLRTVGEELKRRPELAADVLLWTYHFATGLADPPWREIREMGLRVPCRDGDWIPAAEAHLSKDWGGPEPALLDDLLRHTADEFPEMAALRRRIIAGPGAPPFSGHQRERWREFLGHIGVRAGLVPDPVADSLLNGRGDAFMGDYFTLPRALTAETGKLWRRATGRARPQGRRPQTTYLSRSPLYRLAGQDDHVRFSGPARMAYARLIAHGLATWPDETLTVTVRRHNDGTDAFDLPTPAAAFLSEADWLPVTAPRDRSNVTYRKAREAWSDRGDALPFAAVIASRVRSLIHARPVAEARATRLGIRTWDDPATAADRVLLLARLLETGQVPDTVVPPFRNAYEDAWTDFVRHRSAGTPLDRQGRVPLVVTRGTTIDVIDLAAEAATDPVFVQDTDERQRLRMLEQCGLPVLRLRRPEASAVANRLVAAFGARVQRVSGVHPAVTVDGIPFIPSDTPPLLVQPDQDWFADLIAAVIDLRGRSVRASRTDVLRRANTMLRRIRVVEADRIEAGFGGNTIEARHLAVPDDAHPTVLLLRSPDRQRLLERATPAVGELLGHPSLDESLRLALIELARDGYGPDQSPSSAAIADVLGEPVARVEEVRAAIRPPDEVTLEVLVPLVATLDPARAHDLDGDDTAVTPGEIAAWLCDRSDATATPDALLQAATDGLDAARRLLGIELRPLNAAIRALGAPYQPLTDPEGIAQQFRAFVAERTGPILDALRAASLAEFRAGRPLDRYVGQRTLAALGPDPEWALDYFPTIPVTRMIERVNAWLAASGANDLGVDPGLEPLDRLRIVNRTTALSWAAEAARVVRAYETQRGLTLSGLPGEPTAVADAASSAGVLDFEPVDADRLLAWAADTTLWPADMPRSTDLGTLGLPADALDLAQKQQREIHDRREQERRTVQIDGVRLVAEETNYAQIATAVRASITPEFRAANGRTSLEAAARPSRRAPGWGGSGTTAARQSRPPEAKLAAIGLAGEIAALEWLKERYPGLNELQCWHSGYRNQLLGDDGGDDTLGYDILVEQGRRRLMFEVKASESEASEFLLTPAEITRARGLRKNERYTVLFITNVFRGAERRIHLLPNPFDPAHSAVYRPVGDGVRYRFTIASR
ncbi:ATP-binding protein [Micromonospora echinofusca]|uniref:ATP-binding protein n=1 Tax=Micromonospora echinofusca TaxID=47858 RepID=UPI003447103C